MSLATRRATILSTLLICGTNISTGTRAGIIAHMLAGLRIVLTLHTGNLMRWLVTRATLNSLTCRPVPIKSPVTLSWRLPPDRKL